VVESQIPQGLEERNNQISSRTADSKLDKKQKVYLGGFASFERLKSQFETFKRLTRIEDKEAVLVSIFFLDGSPLF
jgi:hypothetical protein